MLKCNMVHQVNVDSKSFSTQNAQEENWFICMLLQLIVYSKSYHFPHKMHRRRKMGSTCRSFTQELAKKVWFWFAKCILKRSGSFLAFWDIYWIEEEWTLDSVEIAQFWEMNIRDYFENTECVYVLSLYNVLVHLETT